MTWGVILACDPGETGGFVPVDHVNGASVKVVAISGKRIALTFEMSAQYVMELCHLRHGRGDFFAAPLQIDFTTTVNSLVCRNR